MHLADEVLDHLLGDFDVGDNSIAQRADRLDAVGRFAHHHLGIIAHGLHPLDPVDRFNRDHRGFVEDDALILNIDEGVGGPQINGHVLRTEFEQIVPEAHVVCVP